MFPGPVFHVELLTLARRRRYYVLRFVYGLILLYFIWQNTRAWTNQYSPRMDDLVSPDLLSRIGQQIFSTFAVTQAMIILMITPAQVAGVVADERQRKTLHYLLASRLSSPEIVIGKLAARLLSLYVFLAVGLPIVAMLSFFGGVDPQAVLLFFAACASTTYFLAAASIAVSVHAKRPKEAVSTMYLVEIAWLFGPSTLAGLLPSAGGFWIELYEWIRPLNEWLGASSPFYLMVNQMFRMTSPAAEIEAILWLIGTQLVYGTALVAIAVARLRPIHRNEGATGGRLSQTLNRQARRLLPRPPCGDDAIYWKERYVSRTSPIAKLAGAGVLLGVIGALGYATYQFVEPALIALLSDGLSTASTSMSQKQLNEYLRFVETVIAACWMIGIASSASASLTSEREGDTWISLIATPLTPAEIVRAKMFGAFWAVRWIGLIWLGLLLTGLVLLAVHPLSFLAVILCNAVYLWFACALGMLFSLRSKNSARSLTATIVVLLSCNAIYLIFLAPVQRGGDGVFYLLGCTPCINAVSFLSYQDMSLYLFNGFISGTYQANRALEYVMTYFGSVAAYGFAALVLTFYLVLNFDDAIDRPRTLGGESPTRLAKISPSNEEV